MDDRREYTGSNGTEIRAWIDAPRHHTGFITRGMAASTGGQAWRYVRDGRDWPDRVTGAVYDPGTGDWLPVAPGDHVVRTPTGYTVESEGPCP